MDLIREYACPICMELMIKGHQLKTCSHSFCLDCSANINSTCPTCRKDFKEEDKEEKDFKKMLKSKKVTCACEKSFTILKYNDHYEKCDTLKKEEESRESKLLDKSKMKKTVNRSTFNCPLCKEKNMDRKGIVEHVLDKHKKEKAVCPICITQPWGDPNHKTHLAGHMDLRHKFDYDTVTDYDKDDDEILNQILELSKEQK